MWLLDSINSWAAAASLSANSACTIGLTRPAVISGQTLFSSAWAIAAFSSVVLIRNVDPVSVSRLSMSGVKLTSAMGTIEKRDLYDAALIRSGVDIALYVVTANHVEDQVNALAIGRLLCNGDEIVSVVIDGKFRTEFLAGVAFGL